MPELCSWQHALLSVKAPYYDPDTQSYHAMAIMVTMVTIVLISVTCQLLNNLLVFASIPSIFKSL